MKYAWIILNCLMAGVLKFDQASCMSIWIGWPSSLWCEGCMAKTLPSSSPKYTTDSIQFQQRAGTSPYSIHTGRGMWRTICRYLFLAPRGMLQNSRWLDGLRKACQPKSERELMESARKIEITLLSACPSCSVSALSMVDIGTSPVEIST